MPIVLPPDQVGGCQHLQDPGEDRAGRLHIDQPAGSRNRRVLGRRFVETQAEEAAQGERIRRPPCYATFRVDAFEVPAQQQPEVTCLASDSAGPRSPHRTGRPGLRRIRRTRARRAPDSAAGRTGARRFGAVHWQQSTIPASVCDSCVDPSPCRECRTSDRPGRFPFSHRLLGPPRYRRQQRPCFRARWRAREKPAPSM